jgi:hypothetical protein
MSLNAGWFGVGEKDQGQIKKGTTGGGRVNKVKLHCMHVWKCHNKPIVLYNKILF